MLNAGEGHSDILDCRVELETVQKEQIEQKEIINSCREWLERANELEDLGLYDGAATAYRQAVKIKPNYQEAWMNLGTLLCDRFARYEEALHCFENALRVNYLDDCAWFNRGNVLEHLHRYEDAIASYNIVLKLNPDDENAWYSRGWVFYEMGQYEDAIASFEKALSFKPQDDSTWYNTACCHGVLGHTQSAIDCLQKAIELSPNQYAHLAKTEPDFDRIRQDSKFMELVGLAK